MNRPTTGTARTAAVSGAVAVAALTATLAACAPSGGSPATPPSPSAATEGDDAEHGPVGAGGLPSAHVHGVQINPADGRVYLASHEGLFRYEDSGPVSVGPVIDLMGFTVAGPDHFYASGHPGAGVDLPQPVGLIESTDAGQTWSAVSRGGQSDFHALTASETAVIAFDGTSLEVSPDGMTWSPLDPPVAPYSLDTSPDGQTVLLTTESGPVRSTDGGQTWAQVDSAPVLQFVAFSDADVVFGVAPDGTVSRSADAGATWTQTGEVTDPPQALEATHMADGSTVVVVVTTEELLTSTDDGATFAARD